MFEFANLVIHEFSLPKTFDVSSQLLKNPIWNVVKSWITVEEKLKISVIAI